METRSSWTGLVAVLAAVGAFLALFTALAANIDTVQGWFGRRADMPVSISIQAGKLIRPDDGNLVVAIVYKKIGAEPLHNCKFWMDTGEVVFPGEMPEFAVAAGPSTKDLQVPFRLVARRALNSPKTNLTLACDEASSVAVPLNLLNGPVVAE